MQPSMPRPSTSTFMNFSASMSSLSHSMIWRSSIAAGSIGTRSSSRSCVSTKPPGCCDMWRGVADQLAGEIERQPQPPIAEVEVELARPASRRRPRPTSPRPGRPARRSGPRAGRAPCRPRGPRRARGSADDRGQRGAVAAVGLVDPLDDLFAALMLEIDVDVGRLAPFAGDEPLEQQLVLDRIDAR